MAFAAVFLMTLGTDEAWVLNGVRSFLRPAIPHLSSEPVPTSGGLFAVANLALEYAFGSAVWVHRAFSLACLFAILVVTSWLARGRRVGRLDAVAVAPLLAVPGTIEIGTAALGTSTALLLLLAAMVVWTEARTSTLWRVVVSGILFGLGAASRFDLVLFAPALLLVSTLRWERGSARLTFSWAALGALAIGLALFVCNQLLMSAGAHAMVTARLNVEETMAVTGVSGSLLDYPKLLNRFLAGTAFAAPATLALASMVALQPPGDGEPARSPGTRRFTVLALVTAWILWVAWLVRAPIAHLRYLWPSLALFAITAGVGLSSIHHSLSERGEWAKAALCRLLALALVVSGMGGTLRSLVIGESDYVSWEWSREMGVDYFRRFQHVRDQAAAVRYLRSEVPPDAVVLSYVPFPLRYLGDRPVIAADRIGTSRPAPRTTFLVLTPMVGTYLYLRPDTFAWIAEHGQLRAQFGRYSFYELPGGPPDDPGVLRLGRTNYERHPASDYWFGRSGPNVKPAASQRTSGSVAE